MAAQCVTVTIGCGAYRSFITVLGRHPREPLLPTDDRLNLPAGAGLQCRAATRWHVGSLSCSVGEDASHNYDSNKTDNYAAKTPSTHLIAREAGAADSTIL